MDCCKKMSQFVLDLHKNTQQRYIRQVFQLKQICLQFQLLKALLESTKC
jgi:hypothetical protein